MDHNNNSEYPENKVTRERDRFPRKSIEDLNDLVEYRGEAMTVREWAEKLGVTSKAILLRYSRYCAGKIDKDRLMAPGQPQVKQRKPEQQQIKDTFFTQFNKEVAPHLGKEMKHFMRTGEQGPGLKMLKDFSKFIPVTANEAIAESNKAIWAVVFKSGELPQHYEAIED